MQTKRFKAPVIQYEGIIAPQYLTPIVLDGSAVDAPCLYAYKPEKHTTAKTAQAYAPLYVKSSMNPHYGHKGVWLYLCNHNQLEQALEMLGTTQESINPALNRRCNELLDLCSQNRIYGGHGPAMFARACNRWPEYQTITDKIKATNETRKAEEALERAEREAKAKQNAETAFQTLLKRLAEPDMETSAPFTLEEVKQVARHYGLWESQPIRTRGAWEVVDTVNELYTRFVGTKKQIETAKRSTAIPKLVALYRLLKAKAQMETPAPC